MNNVDNLEIINSLQSEVEYFSERNKKQSEYFLDSFRDHKNRYLNDIQLVKKNFKKKNSKVLDVGCSPCHMTYCLKQMGYKVVGLDINPAFVSDFIKGNKLEVKRCDIEKDKFPFKDEYFDYVLFNEVFEHLRINPYYTLSEIYRVLKPDGKLILTTPNLYAVHKIIMFNLGLSFNDASEEFDKLLKYGYMGHIREYSTKEVKKILEKTGFKVKKVEYYVYNKFLKSTFFNRWFEKIYALFIDLFMLFFPRLRQYQIFIAIKQ